MGADRTEPALGAAELGRRPNAAFWRARRVLVTGHTGFKGSWLALWLRALGAEVSGVALDPEPGDALFTIADVAGACSADLRVDLRDAAGLDAALGGRPFEVVFHLAAQPLVRRALSDPLEAYAVNALGSAHLLETLRRAPDLAAVVAVTTDKVYANDGRGRAFVESDPLGGGDPYSASKAAAELITQSYAKTYFAPRGVAVATARGGNVVGGGDFAADRLGPDCVRAARSGAPVRLRQPNATRPWQHVLDCLCGYLLLAEDLVLKPAQTPRAVNIGPAPEPELPVRAFAARMLAALGAEDLLEIDEERDSREAAKLALDSGLARRALGWRDVLVGDAAIAATAEWYLRWAAGADMAAATRAEIAHYERRLAAQPETAS